MRTVPIIMNRFDVGITLPGSKSLTLRDSVLSALSTGTSEIRSFGDCDDFRTMRDSLKTLGVAVKYDNDRCRVVGVSGRFRTGVAELNARLSATSARFLIALAALRRDVTILDGDEGMRARPNKYLLDAITALGAKVTSTGDGYLPVTIVGPNRYITNHVSMRGDVSSHYFSALLQVAPLFPDGLTIAVKGELVSKPYIRMTIDEMKRFGVHVENQDYRSFVVKRQVYQAVDVEVEGDASAASYFSALATIHGGTVRFKNLGNTSVQGDFDFFRVCTMLGASVMSDEEHTTITGPSRGLMRPLDAEVDMKHTPDVAPTLMAIAPLIPGITRITGLSNLRVKESNRVSGPAKELRKLGVQVVEGDDYVAVHELPVNRNMRSIEIATYEDHRMAMSFAVLGTRLGNLMIRDAACVSKTYPRFWEDLDKLYRV